MDEQGRQQEKQAWEGEMFRLLAENVLDYALFIVDPQRHVLSWSKGAERLLGFAEDEIVGGQCDRFFTHEDVRDGVPQRELDEALATGRGDDDRWHVRKDGSRFWASGTVTPLRDGDGRLRGFAKVMRDRTDLKRAEDARDEALAYADAIVATVREPLVVLDGGLRVRTANRSFYRTFQVEPQETEGRPLYELGGGQWDIPALRTLLGEVLPRDAAFDGFEVEYDFPGVGRKAMLLNARKLHREGNHAELILLAVEDVTALREAERRRQDAESRFSEMVKNVRDHSIFLTDAGGVITSWNVAAERIIGYAEAEAVGRHFSLIFTPEDIEAGVPEGELRQAREDGRAEDERWHRRKDGSLFWALGIVTPLHDPQGRLSGFSKVLRDMTEWKRAEEQLSASRARLQGVFETALDAVLLADDQARYVDANPAACELLGYGREELLRRGVFDLTPRSNGEAGRAAWAAFLREGRQAGEYEVSRKDGSTALVEYRAVANVQPGLHLSALRDVTARRRDEEALRASEQRFRTLATHAPVGIFQTDPAGNCVFVNGRWCRIAGLSPEEAAGGGWVRALHPDDRDRVREEWYAAAAAGREFASEYRFLTPDGRTAWVQGKAVALRGEGGAVAGHLGTVADITDQRAAAEALRQSEERLRTLSDNLPDGAIYQVVAGPQGGRRFLYISAGVERLFGVTAAEATADADCLYGLVHEEDRGRVAAAEEAALRDRTPFDCEFRSLTRTGDVRWLHCRSAPRRLPAGEVTWEGVIIDVTERRRAERESRASRDRLDLVVNSVDVGLWYCDLPFDRLAWNAKVKEHFGLPPDAEVTIDTFYERLHPDDRVRTREAIERSIRDRTGYDIEYRTAGPDGRERWVRAIGRTFYGPEGEPVSFDGITVDVTKRVRQEQALKDADRRKDEFLATLAHELRNPLAPLRNGLQLLRLAGDDRATAGQALGMMERQLGQMVRLIDDLLDVSRITRGKLQLRKERVELAAVVRSAVETARPLVESSAHRLAVSLPPGQVYLDADPTRLAQVLANLLTNAAKYTDRGGDIRLAAERRGGEVVVSVRDNGIGIPAEHLPRLFEMFSQVESALERSQGGLGIGLSLVKGLVEMHGGTVEARSEGVGKGSEFVVRLPAAGGTAPDAGDAAGEAATPRRACRILVADDNRDAADSLAMVLRLGGHEVHTAHDGQEAAEAAAWFRPDVALLDIGMPRLNGYEVARHIREQPWGGAVVLVAVTGWGQEEDRRRAAESGFQHHLTKPVEPAALERLLASLPHR